MIVFKIIIAFIVSVGILYTVDDICTEMEIQPNTTLPTLVKALLSIIVTVLIIL